MVFPMKPVAPYMVIRNPESLNVFASMKILCSSCLIREKSLAIRYIYCVYFVNLYELVNLGLSFVSQISYFLNMNTDCARYRECIIVNHN